MLEALAALDSLTMLLEPKPCAKPFGRIRPNLVENHRRICATGEKLSVRALYKVSIAFFSFNHNQHLVHPPGHCQGNAGLIEGWHVENNIVEVACLEVRHHFVESFWDDLVAPSIGRRGHGEIEIFSSRCRRPDQSLRKRARWRTVEKWVNLRAPDIHIHEQNLSISRFREGGSNARANRGSSSSLRASSHGDKLRLMVHTIELEREDQTISNCFSKASYWMIELPWRGRSVPVLLMSGKPPRF